MFMQRLVLLVALGALLCVQLEARCLGSYYFLEEGVPGIQRLLVTTETGSSGLQLLGMIPNTTSSTRSMAASDDLLCFISISTTKAMNCINMTTNDYATGRLSSTVGSAVDEFTQLEIDKWSSFACINQTLAFTCFGMTLDFANGQINFSDTPSTTPGFGTPYYTTFSIARQASAANTSSAVIYHAYAASEYTFRANWTGESSLFSRAENATTTMTLDQTRQAQVGSFVFVRDYTLATKKVALSGSLKMINAGFTIPGQNPNPMPSDSVDYARLLGTGPACDWLLVVNHNVSNTNLTAIHILNNTQSLVKSFNTARHLAIAWGSFTPPASPEPSSPPLEVPINPPQVFPQDPPIEVPDDTPLESPPSSPPLIPISIPCPEPRPSPAPSFYCNYNTGLWSSNGTIETTEIIISSPVIIEGNLTLSGPIIFNGGTSTLTVTGCVRGLQLVTVELTQSEYDELVKTGKLDKLLITSGCDTSGLDNIPITFNVNAKHKSCEKVKASTESQSNNLVSSFVLDKSSCNRWWIILVSVVGGVILICIVITLVCTLHPKLNRHRRTTVRRSTL